METLVFGYAGAPVIVFPTSSGRFFDYENYGMVAALGSHLANGWIQLFCVDSVDSESWYCTAAPPAERIFRHIQYDQYVATELVPAIARRNHNRFLITTGCSFGAFHSVNFALRHPDLVRRCVGLSGLYDMRSYMDGYYDESFYFNNPVDFTGDLRDRSLIRELQRQDIIIVTGQEDELRGSNEHLSANLWKAGVGNALRVWDGFAHDWPYWHKMIRLYIGGHD